jgi:hypothetical protein
MRNFISGQRAIVSAEGQAEGNALFVRRQRKISRNCSDTRLPPANSQQFVFQHRDSSCFPRQSKIKKLLVEAAQRTICLPPRRQSLQRVKGQDQNGGAAAIRSRTGCSS